MAELLSQGNALLLREEVCPLVVHHHMEPAAGVDDSDCVELLCQQSAELDGLPPHYLELVHAKGQSSATLDLLSDVPVVWTIDVLWVQVERELLSAVVVAASAR